MHKYTKEEAREEVKKRVDNFSAELHDLKSVEHTKEAQVETRYIQPLFACLNWDITNEGRGNEFIPQHSLKIKDSYSEPDYLLQITDPISKRPRKWLFIEAKHPKFNLTTDKRYIRQAYQYAHSTFNSSSIEEDRVRLCLLTDFEEFRLFDCRDPKPLQQDDVDFFNRRVVTGFDLQYTDYVEKFDLLWEHFERDHVALGSLDRLEVKTEDLIKKRKTPDFRFLDDLKRWRLMIAQSMYKVSGKTLTDEQLTLASQLLIDRIVLIKSMADRGIETDPFKNILEQLGKTGKAEVSMYEACRQAFERMNSRYNGKIFARDEYLDPLAVENKVLREILDSLAPDKSLYTLRAMPIEIIGFAYEQFLGEVIKKSGRGIGAEAKPEVKKAGGVYYTPRYIVEYIVDNTVGKLLKKCQTPADVAKLKILDPACGSGSFLVGAYDKLLDWHLRYYQNLVEKGGKELKKHEGMFRVVPAAVPAAKPTVKLTIQQKKKILQNNIHGVDIDSRAVEVAQLSLSMKALEGEDEQSVQLKLPGMEGPALPDLKGNLKCGNSLIAPDYFTGRTDTDLKEMKRINPFDWSLAFPQIMKAGGFDCVIGNPPYVRQEILGPDFKEFAASHYKVYHGIGDLYTYFIERGVFLVRPGGYFSYIVINKWMRANYGEPLRRWLKSRDIEEILDFGGLPVFKGATTYPCIIRIRKGDGDNNATPTEGKEIRVANIDTLEFGDLAEYVGKKAFGVARNSLDDKGWSLANGKSAILMEKIKAAGRPLEAYVNGKIFYGIKTGLNEAFVIDAATRKRLIEEDGKSVEIIKPFLAGKDIKRYKSPKSERFVIFTRRGINISEYSAVERYLSNWKTKLMPKPKNWKGKEWPGRKPGTYNWYEIQDTVDYYPEFEKPKILWPGISAQVASFALDESNYYGNDNNQMIISGDKYLLGILNSKISRYFLLNLCDAVQGGFYRLKIIYIEKIPIPEIELSDATSQCRHDKIVQLVDSMLTLHRQLSSSKSGPEKEMFERQIGATDREIDRLVYELYGLTEEEVGIIEEAGH